VRGFVASHERCEVTQAVAIPACDANAGGRHDPYGIPKQCIVADVSKALPLHTAGARSSGVAWPEGSHEEVVSAACTIRKSEWARLKWSASWLTTRPRSMGTSGDHWWDRRAIGRKIRR